MCDTIERRRIRIDELLRKCTDKKLLRGGREQAVELAEEALRIATRPPAVPYPWPQLAAYRLAHLLLRSEDSEKRLDEIDHLLKSACSNPHNTDNALGALPYLYRLAVLHRRSLATTRRKRIARPSELLATFELARKAVECGLENHAESPSQSPLSHDRGPIQRELFNLLELAAYFLGADYAPLEGLGAIDVGNLNRDSSWFLVGPNPEISSVRYSRALAMAELQARGNLAPQTVVFRLMPNNPEESGRAEWRTVRDSSWRDANTDQVKLLAMMLRYPDRPRAELCRDLDGIDSDDAFRQLIRRTKMAFHELSGMTLFSSGRNCLQLATGVEVYGAVHNSTFRRRTRT